MSLDLLPAILEHRKDFVTIVRAMGAAGTVYTFGGKAVAEIKSYIGPVQEENIWKICNDARKMLSGISEDRRTEPSPNIFTPLLEAACQESRSDLQTKWAALLANALVDNGKKVRKDLIYTLASLDPTDVCALHFIFKAEQSNNIDVAGINRTRLAEAIAGFEQFSYTKDDWLVSVDQLSILGCISVISQKECPFLKPLGRVLIAACRVE